MDYSNINNLLNGFDKILSLSSIAPPPQIPAPLILVGVPKRSGLSAIKIASRIISRKSEAGLPVGMLPNGETNPDEIMERIRIEEIIRALQEEAIISIGIPPGITLSGAGISPAGPVTVYGSTITTGKGFGIIQ